MARTPLFSLLERAVRPAWRVLAVALIEPRDLMQHAHAKHAARQHQRVILRAEHCLCIDGGGKDSDQREREGKP